jgi:hypothetical protein
MFIGHFAVAFAAKPIAPKTSLGTLAVAATLIDLLWPIFLILGLEHVRIDPGNTAFTPLDFYDYPITHSVPGTLFWAALLAGAWYWRHRLGRSAALIGALVFSHWLLDFVTHRPDMPILPGGPYVGLGLWNTILGTVLVEGLLFAGGVAIYARHTRARDRIGTWSLVALVAFLSVMYLAGPLSPPPPTERVLGYGALVAWLLVPWPYWVDRHRAIVGSLPDR